MKGGVSFLKLFQSKPLKNGWAFISFIPLIPNLLFLSLNNFVIKSFELKLKFESSGILKFYYLINYF